jgi:hypothetical protein
MKWRADGAKRRSLGIVTFVSPYAGENNSKIVTIVTIVTEIIQCYYRKTPLPLNPTYFKSC